MFMWHEIKDSIYVLARTPNTRTSRHWGGLRGQAALLIPRHRLSQLCITRRVFFIALEREYFNISEQTRLLFLDKLLRGGNRVCFLGFDKGDMALHNFTWWRIAWQLVMLQCPLQAKETEHVFCKFMTKRMWYYIISLQDLLGDEEKYFGNLLFHDITVPLNKRTLLYISSPDRIVCVQCN